MYKLIIGNVRINVSDDAIHHAQAIKAARQAILKAANENKVLSSIELILNDTEVEAIVTERTSGLASRKTLKQSMIDTIIQNISDKLLPPAESMVRADYWCDDETGQEWRGSEVTQLRQKLSEEFTDLLKNMGKNC